MTHWSIVSKLDDCIKSDDNSHIPVPQETPTILLDNDINNLRLSAFQCSLSQHQISKGKCRPANCQIYVQLQAMQITELRTRYKTAGNRVIFVVGNKTQDLLDPTDIQGFQRTVDKIMEEIFTKNYWRHLGFWTTGSCLATGFLSFSATAIDHCQRRDEGMNSQIHLWSGTLSPLCLKLKDKTPQIQNVSAW